MNHAQLYPTDARGLEKQHDRFLQRLFDGSNEFLVQIEVRPFESVYLRSGKELDTPTSPSGAAWSVVEAVAENGVVPKFSYAVVPEVMVSVSLTSGQETTMLAATFVRTRSITAEFVSMESMPKEFQSAYRSSLANAWKSWRLDGEPPPQADESFDRSPVASL